MFVNPLKSTVFGLGITAKQHPQMLQDTLDRQWIKTWVECFKPGKARLSCIKVLDLPGYYIDITAFFYKYCNLIEIASFFLKW